VTTPNNWHFPIARDFLKAGFHVMCEKPMTLNSKEAKDLQKLVRRRDCLRPDAQLHGLPDGEAGSRHGEEGRTGQYPQDCRAVPQGWLATALEKTGQMQASWRTDPKQTGAGGCVGDIGTHAANLAEYVSG